VSLRDAPGAIAAVLQSENINPARAASWSTLERLFVMTGDAPIAAIAANQFSVLKRLPPDAATLFFR
jgi:hypothetical protein